MLRRQLVHATGGGMETQLELVKRQSAADRNDQFTIEDKLPGLQRAQCPNDIGKITRERLTRFRLQKNVVSVAKGETTKTVPFRFILPAVAARDFIDRARLHRWQRGFDGQGHSE